MTRHGHDGLVQLGRRNARRRRPDQAEEWTQERLGAWVGRALSQVRVSAVSLVLDFWELDDDFSAWLYADEIEVSASGVNPVESRVRRTERLPCPAARRAHKFNTT